MEAEIIAVGSEMLTPDRLDTNSLYITRELNRAGFRVHIKSIVGDVIGDITAILTAALKRSRIIIVSGGLGPTEDDITRQAVSLVLARPLRIDQGILDALRERFAARGYRMSKNNERQAEILEGAEILTNSLGTAPGMWIDDGRAACALLPGPPHELQTMFETGIRPRLARIGAEKRLERRSLRIIGLTESGVDSRVTPLCRKYGSIETTILAPTGYIGITLQQWLARGEEPEQLDRLAAEIRDELGDAVFTTADESLELVVGRMLRERGLTLSVAESCTSGIIGMQITRVPGSSDYFRGGILCYSNEAKENLCGVPAETLASRGAVSAEVAEALARGVRRALASSVGLAVTGIAGPGGGSETKPVGLIYVGLADGETATHVSRILPGDREAIRERTAQIALSYLRQYLISMGSLRN
jgi:nicotinamide-nucleotide amidase